MSILDIGCACNNCLETTKKALETAREEWKQGKREIKFIPYSYECGDGCCTEYGTHVYVNGFQIIGTDGDNVDHVIQNLMEFLEIKDVNIEWEYEDEI